MYFPLFLSLSFCLVLVPPARCVKWFFFYFKIWLWYFLTYYFNISCLWTVLCFFVLFINFFLYEWLHLWQLLVPLCSLVYMSCAVSRNQLISSDNFFFFFTALIRFVMIEYWILSSSLTKTLKLCWIHFRPNHFYWKGLIVNINLTFLFVIFIPYCFFLYKKKFISKV